MEATAAHLVAHPPSHVEEDRRAGWPIWQEHDVPSRSCVGFRRGSLPVLHRSCYDQSNESYIFCTLRHFTRRRFFRRRGWEAGPWPSLLVRSATYSSSPSESFSLTQGSDLCHNTAIDDARKVQKNEMLHSLADGTHNGADHEVIPAITSGGGRPVEDHVVFRHGQQVEASECRRAAHETADKCPSSVYSIHLSRSSSVIKLHPLLFIRFAHWQERCGESGTPACTGVYACLFHAKTCL